VGEVTYFHVRLETPSGLHVPPLTRDFFGTPGQLHDMSRLPQLVPQEGNARNVYYRWPALLNDQRANGAPGLSLPPGLLNGQRADDGLGPLPRTTPPPAPPARVDGLEFAGQLRDAKEAKFLLLYAVESDPKEAATLKGPAALLPRTTWVEVPLTLNFAEAKAVPAPKDAKAGRNPQQRAGGDNLEGLWAEAQAARFAVLEAQTADFGFYTFARQTTGRKYGVFAPPLNPWGPQGQGLGQSRLYEITTGAAAVAESLQLNRLRGANFRDEGERAIDVSKVQGVDVAEHPWKQMIGDKKAAPEPLAQVVPDDNYYVHFKTVAKLDAFARLLNLWGGNITHGVEASGRNYYLQDRYEKQLCLKSAVLAKELAPAAVRGVALTGSDPYLREGSDVAVIVHCADKAAVLAAVKPFVTQAEKEFGRRLDEGKEFYRDVAVERFVTPRREVTLYRAAFGDFLVFANSPVGVRRIIDAHLGKHKALADSLDFRYMRTVFGPEDEQEDGFAFLSDPFIRRLVGPASQIKRKRRFEALTSLYMATNGALFTGWETGKLPEDRKVLLASSSLKLAEIYLPEGKEVNWDAGDRRAVSEVYNTLDFSTPLIELPIDRITAMEDREYQQFRAQYMNLWSRYFDPVGIRVALTDKQVRMETYILPLIKSSAYNGLREFSGGGTTAIDPAAISPKTLVQLTQHIAPDLMERGMGMGAFGGGGLFQIGLSVARPVLMFLGDWGVVRLDDSPVYGKLAEYALRVQRETDEGHYVGLPDVELMRLVFQVPLTVGVSIKNPLTLAAGLAAARVAMNDVLPGGVDWAPMEPAYKNVSIVRLRPRPNLEVNRLFGNAPDAKDPVLPTFYYALIDGVLYVSLSNEPLKGLIDASSAKREGKKGETVEVNSSLYAAPGAAVKAGDFLRFYLEYVTHERATANLPIRYALYRCGVVGEKAGEETVRTASLRCFGFVPVSPDGAAYRYEARSDEVVNQRHGSLRRPQLQAAVDANSPLGRLLAQIRSVRADLRFREDGVQTVLTIDRKAAGE
jgi:hypothetical protein